jgi:hypothetical protein
MAVAEDGLRLELLKRHYNGGLSTNMIFCFHTVLMSAAACFFGIVVVT